MHVILLLVKHRMLQVFRRRSWLLLIVFIGILPILGWSLDWPLLTKYQEDKCKRERAFVNHDLACGDGPVISKTGYIATKNDIVGYVQAENAAGRLSDVSVYFRDLRSGPVLGINETADFAPASLMKLPLVFAFFDIEEAQPGFLQTKIPFTRTHADYVPELVQTEVPRDDLVEGQSYSLEELLKDMIVYSDNDAYYVLVEYANRMPDGPPRVLATFQELGIVDPRKPDEEVVSVRSYAALYRLLYNVSYLSVENSEKLLAWMAESVYDKGLAAGVPQGVVVANKFGERDLANGTKQLHDCGIIYFPDNPYSLCIMTKGKDYGELRDVIREISKMIYEEVDSRRQ